LHERTEYHSIDDKLRLLLNKFVPDFDFSSGIWSSFMQFKNFRDLLVHPRQADDKTEIIEYQKKVQAGFIFNNRTNELCFKGYIQKTS